MILDSFFLCLFCFISVAVVVIVVCRRFTFSNVFLVGAWYYCYPIRHPISFYLSQWKKIYIILFVCCCCCCCCSRLCRSNSPRSNEWKYAKFIRSLHLPFPPVRTLWHIIDAYDFGYGTWKPIIEIKVNVEIWSDEQFPFIGNLFIDNRCCNCFCSLCGSPKHTHTHT